MSPVPIPDPVVSVANVLMKTTTEEEDDEQHVAGGDSGTSDGQKKKQKQQPFFGLKQQQQTTTNTTPSATNTLLSLYWDLADLDVEKRLEAASQLLHRLHQEQFQLVSPSSSSYNADNSSFAALQESGLCHADVSYALNRLFKGLGSGRLGARQGFSLCLIEVGL